MIHNIIGIDFKTGKNLNLSQAYQLGDSFIFPNGDSFKNGVFTPGIITLKKNKFK